MNSSKVVFYLITGKVGLKVAIVHDWLVASGGAEKVLKCLLELYPEAEIYSIVDFLSEDQRKVMLNGKRVNTSFIQKLPMSNPHFRKYMSLFSKAIESFDLSSYNLIISSSWAFAKGVKTHSNQTHVCYCYTPIRYAWDMINDYTQELPWYIKPIVKRSLHSIRKWDIASLGRVDHFIAISSFIQERIKRTYKRDAQIIYPPVDTSFFSLNEKKEDYYITASRLVPYKKTALIVEAFNKMNKPLIVIGDGGEYEKIKKMASSNVKIMGYQDNNTLKDYLQKARGFVYGALEDFGIAPIEAMACGTPVIALGRGGTKETVIHGKTGIHYQEQSTKSIISAINNFEKMSFDAEEIRLHAEQFSAANFKSSFQKTVNPLCKFS